MSPGASLFRRTGDGDPFAAGPDREIKMVEPVMDGVFQIRLNREQRSFGVALLQTLFRSRPEILFSLLLHEKRPFSGFRQKKIFLGSFIETLSGLALRKASLSPVD